MFTVPQPQKSFHELFFARTMRQQFNDKVVDFQSDENEAALVKYVRALHKQRVL